MSGMEIVYSPPETVQRLRDLAEALIQLNSGLMTGELRQVLDQKAAEFGVHRLDVEDILKELSPVQSAPAQVRSSGSTRIDIMKESSPVPSTIINEKDGSQLVLIPEGVFLAGGSAKGRGRWPAFSGAITCILSGPVSCDEYPVRAVFKSGSAI